MRNSTGAASRMTLRSPAGLPLASIAALLACFSLTACKDTNNTAPPVGSSSGPGSSAGHVAGDPNAGGAFDKPRKADGDLKIKIITNGISPFWDPMIKGMEVAKTELKVDASWQGPDPADNSKQKSVLNDAIAAQADGIAVSPIEADAFAASIDSAIDKGIPVITFDSDAPKSKRLAYLGTNNFEAGRVAGEETKKLFPADKYPNGAKLVAFVGNMTAQNARDRFDGFKKGLEGSKIEFLQDPFTDDKSTAKARQNVADAITKNPGKIDGFVGLYSYNGPAIVDEVVKQNLRSKVKIICFDGEPKTLENLGKGLVDVTVVQKPYEFGRLATRLLTEINRQGLKAAMEAIKPELDKLGMTVKDNIIDTGVTVITPANAAEFIKKLKDLGLEST